jgi:hypothetical protein
VHVDGAVARTREAVAEADVGALRRADQPGEVLDLGRAQAADRRRPFRAARLEVGLELARCIGVFLEIGPVGVTVAEEHVHDRAGERPVRSRPHHHLHVCLLHGAGVVDVDAGDPGPALLPGDRGMRHHVDLRVHGIGAPDHDQIGLLHLARIGARHAAGSGDVARPRQRDADRVVHAGVFLGVPQAIDAVAHHEAHRSGVIVGPNGFRPVAPLGLEECLRRLGERVVPGQLLPDALSLRAFPL